jgi:hypothetical protein
LSKVKKKPDKASQFSRHGAGINTPVWQGFGLNRAKNIVIDQAG